MHHSALNPSPRIVYGTVCVAAISWPWGAYQEVYFGHGLFSGTMVILMAALAASWIRSGRPNIPYDLLWPVLLIGGGAAVYCWLGEGASAGSAMAGCGTFLLALHGGTRQSLVYRALALSVLSAGGVAVLTVVAEFNYAFPTFFSPIGGAVGAGPSGLADALYLFSWSALSALPLLLGRRQVQWKRGILLLPLAALGCAVAFFLLFRRLQGELPGWQPNYGLLMLPALLTLLFPLYLAARVVARISLLSSAAPFSPRNQFGVLLLVFVLVLAFMGQVPPAGLCFSFGLVAALGVPRSLRDTSPVKTSWAWLLVAPVLFAHAFMLFPGDARDYLHQAVRAERLYGVKYAANYLGLVLARYPGEAPALFQTAMLELEQGRIDAGADSFLRAMRETRTSRILPPPEPAAVNEFLARLQDRTGKLSGIAYERCLIAAGREDEAVSALKLRLKPGAESSADPEPLRRALSSLLGCGTAALGLIDWTAAELLAGLTLCGDYCQTAQAPADIPRRYLPAVLAARPLHDGRMVTAFYPGGQMGRSWNMPPCAGETLGEGESWWLDPVVDGETGDWYAPLAGAAAVGLGPEMRVSLVEDAQYDCGPGAGAWTVLCLLP